MEKYLSVSILSPQQLTKAQIGKLSKPRTYTPLTGLKANISSVPKFGDDSQNDNPQPPPDEPSPPPAEPSLPPAEQFTPPIDQTFATGRKVGTTPVGDDFTVASTIEFEIWQWLNQYCDEAYGNTLSEEERWIKLTSTLNAKIIESSQPGPYKESDTILEPARRLYWSLYSGLQYYCDLNYKKMPFLGIADPSVPSGDDVIVEEAHPVQPADGPNGPEHDSSPPSVGNVPPVNCVAFSPQEVEEVGYGTSASNEPTAISIVAEHIPDQVHSGDLTYPQLDYSSSDQNAGSDDPDSPDEIPNPPGTSYGLNPSHLVVKSE